MTDRNDDHLKPNLAKARVAMRRKWLESRGGEPPAIPDGVDWRPLRGFPGYYIDRDKAVWTHQNKGGWPGPWRKSGIVMKGRHHKTPSACLRRPDGTVALVSVARLHRDAFLHPDLPAGSPRVFRRDDDGDRDNDAMGLPMARTIAPARINPPPAPAPILSPRAMPRHPAPPIVAFAKRSTPDHPGGRHRLGPMARGSDHGRAKLDEAAVIEMRRLRHEGWSTERLAERFGVTLNTVRNALKGSTWSHIPGAIADIDDRPKLDEAKVAEIRRLHALGWKTARIAREFGIYRTTARDAINGKTWSYIEPAPFANGGTP